MESRKITVKHYLNKRAKPRIHGRDKYFPLYIQIIVSGKKAQIKSKINEHLKIYRSDIERVTQHDEVLNDLLLNGYFSDNQMKNISRNKVFPLFHLLSDEVQVITRIIKFNKPFENQQFTLSNFSEDYRLHTTEITQILDNRLKILYLRELKTIFLKSIDEDENRDLFKIANYFIHFINWANSFSNFYESTFEVMPSELKSVENYLSHELRTTIKAFMAYHTRVNILRRFFEKREKGKISTLSFLDWEMEIKEFLRKEFENIFGEQKALEYILSLDTILRGEVNPSLH
jgi:hypothetical protein